MEGELLRAAVNAGVGGAIAGLIIFLSYKLVSRLIMNIGMRMVAAFEAQADAISKQANSMEGLTNSIREFVGRDNSEHREMLVLLKYIAQKRMEFGDVKNERREMRELCAQTREGKEE
jgi:hypothetical protein